MSKTHYSEKEKLIFNGMIKLLKKGENPYQIKVADIANAAGVGKGTIYDYFENKEEVIKKTLLYNLNYEINQLEGRIKEKSTFKDKYIEILNITQENIQNEFSTFNILNSAGKIPDFNLSELEKEFSGLDYFQRMVNLLDDLLNTGYNEGIINKVEEKFFAYMVIKGSIYMFGEYLSMQHIYRNITIEKAMDYSFQIVIRSLQ